MYSLKIEKKLLIFSYHLPGDLRGIHAARIVPQIVFKDFEGTVENIETRATTIRTYDGRRIVIPNAELFTNSVTVTTAFDNRRLEYDVGIGQNGSEIQQTDKKQ